MSRKKEMIKGKFAMEDGKPVIHTRFGDNPEMFEVPLEEIFEDFEDKGVFIKVEEYPSGRPIYEEGNWEIAPAKEPDLDYKFASPEAYEKFLDMKFGMMVHWGFYSVIGVPESWPANASRDDQDPHFLDLYYTLWQVFNPTEFDAGEWADLAARAGMQFFQLTTKHHDGFCMFDTKTTTWARKRQGAHGAPTQGAGIGEVIDVKINYSIMDTAFKRDIIGEVIEAFRKRGLGIGLYFSHIDWNDPNFRWDKANRSFDPNYGPDTHPEEWQSFIAREKEQLRELFTNYGPLDQIFFDGTWFGLAWEEMVKIVHMCRELQPHCLFNDRGIGPYGDFTSPERWIPDSDDDKRIANRQVSQVWQVCDPIHTSWAYLPGDIYKSTDTLLRNFVDAVSKGGTYVFAIAPMGNGRFPQKTVDTLEFMGAWLHKNGEAIYATRRWTRAKDPDREIFFTRSKDGKNVYVIHFGMPGDRLEIPALTASKDARVVLLGLQEVIPWKQEGETLVIEVPADVRSKLDGETAISFRVPVA